MLFLKWLRSCMSHPGSCPRQQHKEQQQEAIHCIRSDLEDHKTLISRVKSEGVANKTIKSISSDLEDYEIVTWRVKSESGAETTINHKVSSISTNTSRVLPTIG